MKFKEVDEKLYHSYKGKKELLIRKFLYLDEINAIANDCMVEADPLRRLVIYYALLVECATNIDVKEFLTENNELNADKIYNTLAENGVIDFDKFISNISDLRNIIEKPDTYGLVKSFLDDIREQYKDVSSQKLINELQNSFADLDNRQKLHDNIVNFNKMTQQ